jgi:hypothetical protein
MLDFSNCGARYEILALYLEIYKLQKGKNERLSSFAAALSSPLFLA